MGAAYPLRATAAATGYETALVICLDLSWQLSYSMTYNSYARSYENGRKLVVLAFCLLDRAILGLFQRVARLPNFG